MLLEKRSEILINKILPINNILSIRWYDNEMGYSNKVVDLISYMESVDQGAPASAASSA